MDYKEKWMALKEDMEKAVDHGLKSVGQMDVKDQNRLAAYRYVLDYMNELDNNEKTIQKINDEILNELFKEIFNDLSDINFI